MLTELASKVRDGRVSAAELVELAYDLIEKLDGELHAVVALRDHDRALREARAVEASARAGDADAFPLLGLPLLVKDNHDVAGMRTTYASVLFEDAPAAERDALVVERLRAAGAIVVGKSNLPELAFSGFTDSDLFVAARNPWGTEWSPGGSSGGSGAALAAGMVPLATATDGGGSIRIPAALCGLAGLKPTNGLVGRRPIPSWMDLSTDGPLATTVDDAALLLEVTAGGAGGDIGSVFGWSSRPSMPSRVIAAPRTWDFGPLPAGVDERYRASLAAIESSLGLAVEEIEPASILGGLGDPADDWFVLVSVEELQWIGRERVVENLDRFSPGFRFSMELALDVPLDRYVAARRNRFAYARRFDELLGEDAVFVCPTLGFEGWLADGTLPGSTEPAGADGYNAGEANLTGHPAISVPSGLCPNGIPFGLQITGPRWRDDIVLEFARAWERANPWERVAPGYDPFDVPG
jgi:Asp-tRNA(Asn)/Glu-tRNA(Gln) amidotransferase A subunit family amidase